MLFNMDKVKFGLWLQTEREKHGWSQAELARRSGIHRQNVYKIENGGAMPSVETYIALADAFNLSPLDLFRVAGLMPEIIKSPLDEDIQYLTSTLPTDEDKEDILAYIELRHRLAEQRGKNETKNKPRFTRTQ
jgi:transcriptional regulator with XRE-family HTH domain